MGLPHRHTTPSETAPPSARNVKDTENDPLYRRMRRHAERKNLNANDASLEDYKEYLRLENEMVMRYHRKGDSGLRVCRARSIAIDVLLENLLRQALEKCRKEHGKIAAPVSLLALGGYGRAELSPWSDIDIMFLYPSRKKPGVAEMQKTITDTVLYILWDLGLKVGHSSRTGKEALEEARKEVESKNSMLEMRFIAGDRELYDKFSEVYASFIRKDDALTYIEQRLEDQRVRHDRFGNTIFLQEPDIKNGVGGLRDYQNILWMARLKLNTDQMAGLTDLELLSKNEQEAFTAAYDYLLRVRNELHLLSNRPTDLLNLDRQPKVAWNLGYRRTDIFRRVEYFMRDYYRQARIISQTSQYLERKLALSSRKLTFRDVLDSRKYVRRREIDGFLLTDNILTYQDPKIFEKDPERLIRIFRHAQQFNAEIDFELGRLIQRSRPLIDARMIQSPTANKSFRSILQTIGGVYPALSQMHELGVLMRILPEWRDLNCLVQHEYYHRYTADTHTLRTIRELDAVFNASSEDPLYGKYKTALRDTETPALLYLILLLHDIGKGDSIKGHAERGAEMADSILDRMGVNVEMKDEILFIIRNHLEMARFWQHYDVDDPRTLKAFAERIENADYLRYLYVHTFCDAKGTSSSLWNGYKDMLHTSLYYGTLKQLGEDEKVPDELSMIPKEVIQSKVPELSDDEIEAHYNLLPERYFIYSSAEEVTLHLKMVNRLLQNISEADSLGSLVPVVEWQDDLNLSLTVVNVVTWDRAGLFFKLAGAFSVAGLSIVSSKAITRADHITIDTFYVCEPSGGVVQSRKARELFEKHLEESLLHNRDLWPAIVDQARKHTKPSYMKQEERLRAPLPQNVNVYHELSLRRTIIEVQTTDSLGLLYRLAKAIYDHGFDITFARIATERDVAVDTFYIERINRAEATDETQDLLALRESLNAIVATDATHTAVNQ